MNKLRIIIALLFVFGKAEAQSSDSLYVYYYENYPFAYMESGNLRGIEIEIIQAYVIWRHSYGSNLVVTYKPYKEFSTFYDAVKRGNSNVIGLGSVTINSEREKEVTFSPPYLQNIAVLITAGKVPTLKSKTSAEVPRVLGNMSAIAVNKSSHAVYLDYTKKSYLPALKIETTETQNKVLDKIVSDNSYFGYVDIVAYWSYVRNNPSRFLKIQKVFNEPEYLGFIMPQNSMHKNSINQFFESGFGFTATKAYHQILEKYLGYEIIESVEIK